MHIFKWLFVFLPTFTLSVKAQHTYTFQQNIFVTENDFTLSQPFSGGFIAPQYSSIDVNLDGVNDLFVFDRASNKIFIYVLENSNYVYSPQYESLFPKGLKNWVLLRDYNCDGKMDLFTSSLFGISLFENTSATELSWVLKEQTIFTEGSNGQTNLQVSSLDLPAIGDVDNDGDLDILNFNFATGGGIEFHQNFSVENSGACALALKRMTRRYGEFDECTCETYVFGVDDCPVGGREAHSGGKSILSFYNASSIVQDIMIGQEFCTLPAYLSNVGTLETPSITSINFDLLPANQANTEPLRMEYPAYFTLDLFNNNTNNLLVAPNNYITDGSQNYTELSYNFRKTEQGNYQLIADRFLKEAMIDVGHKASPVFTDLDFDGDEDLLIGTGILGNGASIWMYENTGTSVQPSFDLVTKNYLDVEIEGNETIKLQLYDIDANGLSDLILYKIKDNEMTALAYLHSSNPITPYTKSNTMILSLPQLSVWDNPTYFDLGTKTGLFIGKQAGNLEYYTTTSSLATASWQSVSTNYLGIEENFNKRNLHVLIADVNANGIADLLTLDDSGEIIVYENFISENKPSVIKGVSEPSNDSFNLNFGKITQFSTTNLYGSLEPSICVGLLTGGLQLLKSTNSTNAGSSLELKIITYPNPVENKQVFVQPNKNGVMRIIDASGKVIIDSVLMKAGEQTQLELQLLEGMYLVEVVSNDNQKKVSKIVITN